MSNGFTVEQVVLEVKQDVKELKRILERHIEHSQSEMTKIKIDSGRLKWAGGLLVAGLGYLYARLFI